MDASQGGHEDERRAREELVALAHREFDRQDKGSELHSRQLETFAGITIRTLGLVSAGAVAAVLGFYSANYAHLSVTPGALETINDILAALMKALLFTLVTPGFGYFSQLAYQGVIDGRRRDYVRPFVHETSLSHRWHTFGDFCRWLAVGSAFLGLVSLGFAGFLFLSLVR